MPEQSASSAVLDAEKPRRVRKPGSHGLSPFGARLAPPDAASLCVAYADPPYIGMEYRYDGRGVDYKQLIAMLEATYPAGWALSASMRSLAQVLPLCPPGTRTAAWVKPFYGYKPGVSPQYAWEPVLYIGGRRRSRLDLYPDYLIQNAAMSTGGRPSPHRQVLGVKPVAFSRWIFGLLNVSPDRDELVDVFPGSGAVRAAWDNYQIVLPETGTRG